MAFQVPSSLRIAPMAAKHGAHRRLKIRNAMASPDVQNAARPAAVSRPSSSVAIPLGSTRIARVPRRFSLASSPVIEDTVSSQWLPNPCRANRLVMAPPMSASMDPSVSLLPMNPSPQS